MTFKSACIQLNSTPDIHENITQASTLIRAAAADGATFIATPENTCRMMFPMEDKIQIAETEENSPAIPAFSNLAKELNIWLLIGSLGIKVSDTKLANRSFLISPEGKIITKYDKMHMFDVELANGETYKESDSTEAGNHVVTEQTDIGTIGMSICYDVRFAYLYRKMAQAGAQILTVAAAFAVPTGEAHWETLLRARAIETGSYVIAPAQTGTHAGDRKTWGHSLIIDPWGKVLADAGKDVGYITAEIDLDAVDKARNAIPALKHDRDI